MFRAKRPPCNEAGDKCEFNLEHSMVYRSPDGKVFRVQRLACRRCGERVRIIEREARSTAWRDAAVEANF